VPNVWRGRSEDKKQGSDGVISLGRSVKDNLVWGEGECLSNYKWLLEAGVAPEQARMVLPQSTLTEWYWSGSLDAFASMCVLRLKGDTQYETRLVAQQIDEVMSSLFPVSWKALVHGEA
jgi:thymidylate synthase (FAD)